MTVGLLQRVNNRLTRSLPMKWVRAASAQPLASITFDDFPKSAWTVGGPMLERYGFKATYYAAGGFCGAAQEGIDYYDAHDLAQVRAAGHEIGCHSFGHDEAPRLRAAELLAEADRNAAFMAAELGEQDLCSYAYPYGSISPAAKGVMARRFATARGVGAGINARILDLAQLKAIPLEHRRWRPDEIDAALDRVKQGGGWVIFFTHDVADAPSPFGCTPAMLDHVLSGLSQREIDVLPVKHAMARAVFGHDG